MTYDFFYDLQGITRKEVETFVDEFDEVERRRTLTCHLKKAEFPKFSGEKELLAIARFLLEHGNALEKWFSVGVTTTNTYTVNGYYE